MLRAMSTYRAIFANREFRNLWISSALGNASSTMTSLTLAILVDAAITGLVTLASPARADRCDDSAKELANQVDRLKVNFRAANVVYLTHPAAKELSVGCRGDKYSIELFAKGDRKPTPEFYALVTKRPRGRPKASETKVPVTLRLDREVVEAFRAKGPGWQTRMNAALREAVAAPAERRRRRPARASS